MFTAPATPTDPPGDADVVAGDAVGTDADVASVDAVGVGLTKIL